MKRETTRLLPVAIQGIDNTKEYRLLALLGEQSKKVTKGVWGMPRLSKAKKDVTSCDKLRGPAHMG